MNEMHIQKQEKKTVEESTLEEMNKVAQCILKHFLKKSNVVQLNRHENDGFFINQKGINRKTPSISP